MKIVRFEHSISCHLIQVTAGTAGESAHLPSTPETRSRRTQTSDPSISPDDAAVELGCWWDEVTHRIWVSCNKLSEFVVGFLALFLISTMFLRQWPVILLYQFINSS